MYHILSSYPDHQTDPNVLCMIGPLFFYLGYNACLKILNE